MPKESTDSTSLSRRAFLAKGVAAAGTGALVLAGGGPASALVKPAIRRAAADQITLTFWTISYFNGRTGTEKNGQPSDYYDWQLSQFQKLHPNVTINVSFIPSTFQGWAKFDAAVAAGSAPDVMWGQAGNQWKYAPQNAIEPFNGHVPASAMGQLLPLLASEYLTTYADGKTYLWPYGIALAGGVFINLDIAEKRRATALVPKSPARSWTTDEFLELAKAMTYGSGTTKNYGTALMTDWTYQLDQFLYGYGANLYNAKQTKMVANSPAGDKGLSWLVDLEHKYKVAAPGSAGRQNSEVLQLFLQGKIGLYPAQPYYVTAFQLQPQLKPTFRWTYVEPPHVPGRPVGAGINVHGYIVAKQHDPAKLDMAMKFVQFLTRPAVLPILANGQGVIPPDISSIKSWVGADPNRYVQSEIIQHAKPLGRLYSVIGPDVWTPMYDASFSLSKTPAQALNAAVAGGNKIIDQYAARYHWPV